MANFSTVVVDTEYDVEDRLATFGLIRDQFLAIGAVAVGRARDASPLMPVNAPGTLGYIYGVKELREQLLDGFWSVDRTCGIESVINRTLGIRIGFQNVDRACDPVFMPIPRSLKGSAAEGMSGPNLFEYSEVEAGPLTGVLSDGIPTYYVMVGEDGSVELSHPVIQNGSFKHFHERIFIYSPSGDFEDVVDPENDPIYDFDVPVIFKDVA